MLDKNTQDKLHSLRLGEFITVYDEIMSNSTTQAIGLHEALALMADREMLNRENRKQARLLKSAKLRYPNVMFEQIDYHLPRKFDHALLRSLSAGEWVRQHRNIIFIGPTGVGKSHFACALGQLACRLLHGVRYYRVDRLVETLRIAHADGSYIATLDRLSKQEVLILDDWGLDQLERLARRDLLEVLEDRSGRATTIITTQLPIEHWHQYIGDNTIADAICDRLVKHAIIFEVQGESIRGK